MITPDELDWMRHSTTLTAEYAASDHDSITPEKRATLRKELKMQRLVMDNIDSAETFTGERAVYYEYMLAHARLEIARYDGLLSEDQFFAQCRVIREARDKTLWRTGNAH